MAKGNGGRHRDRHENVPPDLAKNLDKALKGEAGGVEEAGEQESAAPQAFCPACMVSYDPSTDSSHAGH